MYPLHQIDNSILSRHISLSSSEITPLQHQIDDLTSGFVDQASNGKTLTSMVAGGLANRWAKIGVLAASSPLTQGGILSVVVKGTSSLIGFAAESLTFSEMNRGFQRLEGQAPQKSFLKDWAH